MKSTKKAGGADLNIALVVQGAGGFGVVYTDLPPETTKLAKAKDLLDGGQQKGLVESFKAKLTSSKDFEFGTQKYPAREIVGENDATPSPHSDHPGRQSALPGVRGRARRN